MQDSKAWARLVVNLLCSLEELSEAEVSASSAEEAQRIDAEMVADPESEISAEDVFRGARSLFQ